MNISFIGAGNLATHLATALMNAGHSIVSVYSRTMKSASELARKLGNVNVATDNLECLVPAEIYIISVKDDAVETIVERWPSKCRNGIVVHTAGTLPMTLIATTSEQIGVLYPLQTFSKNKPVCFKEIPCFIESNNEATLKVLQALASSISQMVIELSSEERKHLHVAAVFACNFVNHMVALGYELMERHGIPPSTLLPLIDETVTKLSTMHPHDCQTGPARRGDKQVIDAHLEELKGDEELRILYEEISKSIIRRFQQTT